MLVRSSPVDSDYLAWSEIHENHQHLREKEIRDQLSHFLALLSMESSNPTAIPNPVRIRPEVPEVVPTMMPLFLLPCLPFFFSLSLAFPFLPFPSPS